VYNCKRLIAKYMQIRPNANLSFFFQALGLSMASAEQKWYNLRTTWMFNPLDSLAFAAQPRTVAEAEAEGWVELDNQCEVEGAK
jgi:hypothetical protein